MAEKKESFQIYPVWPLLHLADLRQMRQGVQEGMGLAGLCREKSLGLSLS